MLIPPPPHYRHYGDGLVVSIIIIITVIKLLSVINNFLNGMAPMVIISKYPHLGLMIDYGLSAALNPKMVIVAAAALIPWWMGVEYTAMK